MTCFLSFSQKFYFSLRLLFHNYFSSPAAGPDNQVEVKSIGTLIASYPNPSYYHSYGMTENYFILVEQPLFVNSLRLAFGGLFRYSFEDATYFDDRKKTVIRVFSRKTGKSLVTRYKYTADPLFLFHHINAYEEDDHIVFDVAAYDNPSIIKQTYFSNLASPSEPPPESSVRRFVLPQHMVSSRQLSSAFLLLSFSEIYINVGLFYFNELYTCYTFAYSPQPLPCKESLDWTIFCPMYDGR